MSETEEKTVTITESEYNAYKLLEQLSSFGSRDIASAAEDLKAAGIDEGKFAEWVEDECKSTDVMLQDVDICAMVYNYVLREAHQEFEDVTGEDFSEDIYTYGNYMCTAYDSTSEARENIQKAIENKDFNLESASQLFKWFYEQISE